MNAPTPTRYERFLPWRKTFEIGFWVVFLLGNTVANSLVEIIALRRDAKPDHALWEPVVWEVSSSLAWAMLVPVIVVFSRHFPFHWDSWRRVLPWHLGASLAVSLVHVLGMVALRKLAYAAMGGHYNFGHWGSELLYEYLKDARTYAFLLLLVEFWRLLLRRWQGEASLLATPDEGPPVEPVERPERFLVRKLGREFLVAARDIEWLQASGNYVNLRVRGHDYPLRSTLAGLEEQLDPARFVRIQRSYLVNLEQIASLEPLDTGDARVHLRDGTALPCSRRYRDALRQRIS
jgi:hypothetical protein